MSICAKEQISPTPTTSTVKFLKKSMISRDLFLRRKMRMKGVTIGLSNSSRINTCLGQRRYESLNMFILKTQLNVDQCVNKNYFRSQLYSIWLSRCYRKSDGTWKTTKAHLHFNLSVIKVSIFLTALYWNSCATSSRVSLLLALPLQWSGM